jgi:ABC-type branched-subunit amino acid transport system permease subunit
VAGALFGGLRVTVSSGDFQPLQSLFLFLVATFGGITTVVGALFAGVFLALAPELQKHVNIQNLQPIGIGLGAITLAGNPHGFGGNLSRAGNAIRAALARRRTPAAPAAPPPPAVAAAEPDRVPVGAS